MKYRIFETEDLNGIQEHVIIETEDGGYVTFPAIDSNPNYIQFKLQLAKEQK